MLRSTFTAVAYIIEESQDKHPEVKDELTFLISYLVYLARQLPKDK